MEKKTYIGIDLGGTKLLIGEMDADGNILRTKKYPSGPLSQPEAVELIQRSLDDFLGDAPVRADAIGVGMVGRIDSRAGIWHEIAPDRKERTEIARIISERYGLPCFVDNDVRSATKAEIPKT